jgi:hypothetical protein
VPASIVSPPIVRAVANRGDWFTEADLDPEPLQVIQRAPREALWKRSEEAIARLDQQHPRVARVDMAKIARQREASDLGDGARHLDPGGPAADDHECHQRLASRRIGRRLGLLESEQNSPPDVQRLLQRLQPRRHRRPLVVPEVRVARPRGQDQVVVRHAPGAVRQHDFLRRRVDRRDLLQQHLRIGLIPQHRADRVGDVRRRERRRCDLIEQRLKEMVISAVDHRHSHRRFRQRLRRLQPAEPAADDHDVRAARQIGRWLRPLAERPGKRHVVRPRAEKPSMPEMARPGEEHRYPRAIGGGDHLLVAHRPTGLNGRRYPSRARRL